MNLEFNTAEMRKQKLMIGVPMYGGQCMGTFTKSMVDLTALCMHHGIPKVEYFLFNESLITRARNYIADSFMESDCTHLMFIDSDIGFNPMDVLALLGLTMDAEGPYDIVGSPYPKKTISWEKIKAAVDQGKGDENPQNLEKYVGDYVFNPKAGTERILIGEPCEVLELGTGFMMIPRRSMQKFRDAYPQYMYRPDHIRTAEFDGSRKIMQYFQAEIDPVSERYLSEDYWFCQKAIEIGLKIWLTPWVSLTHTGMMVFAGSLADLAAINVAATADPNALKKISPKVV
jgi:hypothetical protein